MHDALSDRHILVLLVSILSRTIHYTVGTGHLSLAVTTAPQLLPTSASQWK